MIWDWVWLSALSQTVSASKQWAGRSLLYSLIRPHYKQRAIWFCKPYVVITIHRKSIVGTVMLIASTFMLIAYCFRDYLSSGGNEVTNQVKLRVAVPDISLVINTDT